MEEEELENIWRQICSLYEIICIWIAPERDINVYEYKWLKYAVIDIIQLLKSFIWF